MKLWSHQQAGLEKLREAFASLPQNEQRVLGVAPCGAGKTITGAAICNGAIKQGNRVLWIADRSELIDQPAAVFREHGLHVGIIQANRQQDNSAPIQVGTIQTLSRRKNFPPANLLVWDECHLHFNLRAQRVLDAYPGCPVLGLSATPWLLNNRSLGTIYKKLVVIAQPSELIAAGILVKPRVYGPNLPDISSVHTTDGDFDLKQLEKICDKPTLVGDIAKTYVSIARSRGRLRHAILYAVSREHSRSCRDAMRAIGLRAEHVDGDTPAAERKALIDAFKAGEIDVLCNVDILTAGFDFPALECIICARPTQSLALWIQICGRVLRSSPGKNDAVILDHSGNWLRHGFPHADRTWTLETTKRRMRPAAPAPLRTCMQCFAVQSVGPLACLECGAVFPVNPREVHSIGGNLTEITQAWTQEQRNEEFERLCRIAITGKLSRDFVKRGYKTKFGMWPRNMKWPAALPVDIRYERQKLESVAERRGYSRDGSGRFPWVEKKLIEMAGKI